MHKFSSLLVALLISQTPLAQKDHYAESIRAYQKKYVSHHEVVVKKDKKYFRFFPVNKLYKVTGTFEKISDTAGFFMNTSAQTLKHYFKYGRLVFTLSGKEYQLFVYQNSDLMKTEKYRDYLFIPFTDLTSGDESYGSGRYLDFYISDIKNKSLQLDFNKAYNPYCVYSTGYKCPIPPKENALPVAIRAGEMNFAKPH